MPIEVVTGVLVGLLAVVTVLAAYIGILGLARAVTFVRCEECGRLELRSGDAPHHCARAARHRVLISARHVIHLPHPPLHRAH